MSLNIAKGSTVGVYRFENTVKTSDKEENITRFKAYIAKKNEDESYSRMGIEVRFAKDLKEAAQKGFKTNVRYDVEIEDGFITFDEFKLKDAFIQKCILVITKAKVVKETVLEKKESLF